MSRLVRLCALTMAVATAFALLSGPLAESAAAVASSRYESDVITYGNLKRVGRHLHALKASSCLDRFAERQARSMASRRQLFHQQMLPILKTCHLNQVGENVAFGYPGGKGVTAAWMASPGHRANLLNSRHRLIGVGAYRDSRGWWFVSEVLGRSA